VIKKGSESSAKSRIHVLCAPRSSGLGVARTYTVDDADNLILKLIPVICSPNREQRKIDGSSYFLVEILHALFDLLWSVRISNGLESISPVYLEIGYVDIPKACEMTFGIGKDVCGVLDYSCRSSLAFVKGRRTNLRSDFDKAHGRRKQPVRCTCENLRLKPTRTDVVPDIRIAHQIHWPPFLSLNVRNEVKPSKPRRQSTSDSSRGRR